jgi:hypothetical protein
MRRLAYRFSLLMIFSIPWENILNVGGLGTISRLMGLLVIGFWMVTVVVTGKLRKPHPFHFAFGLFILWNMTSTLWSVDVDKTISRIETYIQFFGFVLILWDLYTTRSDLCWGLQAYVFGAYISVIGIINNFHAGNTLYYDRYTAGNFNPNELAIILVLGMPAAWYLTMESANSRRDRFLRIINLLYLPFATYAIILSVSRTGLISVVLSLLFVLVTLFTMLRPSASILILMFLVALIFVGRDYIPQSSLYILEKKQSSLNERDAIWKVGLEIFSDHPLAGIGSNAFSTANQENGKVPHNIVIGLAAETGLVGIFLFIFIFAIVVGQIKYLPRKDLVFWLTILAIWTVSAATHNMETKKQTWLFLTFLVVSGNFWYRQMTGSHQVGNDASCPDDDHSNSFPRDRAFNTLSQGS